MLSAQSGCPRQGRCPGTYLLKRKGINGKKVTFRRFYYMWRILLLPLLVALLVTAAALLNKRKEKRAFQRMQKLFEDELSRNPRISKDNS